MPEYIRKKVDRALEEDRLNRAVELLKQGVEKDPYWAAGHRLLGDIYLEELEHDVYALVEYRKLARVEEEPEPPDRLRLAWAYLKRSFEDKARDVLKGLDEEELPPSMTILDRTYETAGLLERLRERVEGAVSEQSEKLMEKYRDQGDDYREIGRFFRAQKAYEKALEYGDDPRVEVSLARCLVQRKKFPRAMRVLKRVISSNPGVEAADEVLSEVYRRLGIGRRTASGAEEDAADEPPAAGAS